MVQIKLLFPTGVDTILQKTQEDLGRIKKTSYYQRNKKPETPTPGEEVKPIVGASSSANNSSGASAEPNGHKTKWIGFEEGDKFRDLNEVDAGTDQAAATQQQVEEVAEQQPEEFNQDFEKQDENEDDEDIFNTEYVDIATSGELKLAYVPDSPTLEAAAGDDPFDTSDVEKLVGPLPVIKKKKALVSIGAAVEILTAANAADHQQKQHHQGSTASRQRIVQPPTEIQLLCCFDDNEVDQKLQGNSLGVTPSTNHSAGPSSVQQTPHSEVHLGEELVSSVEPDLKDILAEFDVIPEGSNQPIDEEFVKPPKPNPPVKPKKQPELLDEEDFEFEALAYQSLAKQPFPQEDEEEGDDPFDTSSVDKVLKKDQVETSIVSKKAPPSRPGAPPSRPPPPPSASAIAAIAAKIDRPSPAPVRPSAPVNPTVPPLKAQDSFDALFLNDSLNGKEKPTENKSEQEPLKSAAADPFDTSAVDPFDTSSVDPFDTSAIDPFDTSVVNSVNTSATGNTCITVSSPVLPVEPQLQVTSFVLLDDSPVEDEVDPFDTSAVEKILN